jgi:hypothetical protein
MDPRDEADDYGDDAAGGGDDDPFSDLERVSDEEDEDDDGEDLFENQEMCVPALAPSAAREEGKSRSGTPGLPPPPREPPPHPR